MKSYNGEKIYLKAVSTLASESPDHLEPHGTRRDNTKNIAFNNKLYKLWESSKQLKILDLGCAGGGFVKDCIDGGHLGIGIDGSDYSKRTGRGEWNTIPNYLFTGDITKEFRLLVEGAEERLLFDVITLWDVMEHIDKKDIDGVLDNLRANLSRDGIIIMSVGCEEDIINGVKLHQTVEQIDWWLSKFSDKDLRVVEGYNKYFRNQWVKGVYKYKSGFNIVLARYDSFPPEVPKQGMKEKLFDIWTDSRLQINLRRLLYGYVK